MALQYSGSTAGSTLANPPVLMAHAIGGHIQFASSGSTIARPGLPTGANGGQLWFYSSTNTGDTMAVATVFNDGAALGMQNGDVLIGVFSSADSTHPFVYVGVLVSTAGATGQSTSFGMSTDSILFSSR